MANPDPHRVAIGSLRWPVTIALRTQAPAASGSGMQESLTNIIEVRANITPTGAMTFYGSAQVDTPVTHRIEIRWLDWISTLHVVIRDSSRSDGSSRREVFRIRRMMESDGRKRFLSLECELEKRI